MPSKPEPIPATGDAYAGGYAYSVNGAPLRGTSLSADQFSGYLPWETSAGMPLGSNTETGSSL
jgi:hypothetical protein